MWMRIIALVVTGLAVVTSATANIRVFMSADGEQTDQPVTGATFLHMEPDSTAKIIVWMEDTTPEGDNLNSYQMVLRDFADPREGATGSVTYINRFIGQSGGNSIAVDFNRPDWVFTNIPILVPAFFNETPLANIFGVIYALPLGLTVNPAELRGIQYLCEFELFASAGASGTFDLRFNVAPEPPPLSALFNSFGGEYIVNTKYQPLTVTVGNPAPIFSQPPDGAVDARQSFNPDDGIAQGWTAVELHFPAPSDAAASDFEVESTGKYQPVVAGVVAQGQSMVLEFEAPLEPGTCTTVRHIPSGWDTTIAFLPGDVNGDRRSGARDILTLIDHLNGVLDPPARIWQCDTDRSGACDVLDIIRLIDVLNGAHMDHPWNGATLHRCRK